VAGSFYPSDPATLRQRVTALLDRAPTPPSDRPAPLILISPHAGYEYSGSIAASAFRQVQGQSFDAVVVIGFTHRDRFDGTSVDDRQEYVTPLGSIPVDQEATAFLLAQPGLSHVEQAHASQEHSLEVMLPFLQVALSRFRLVPLLMGNADEQTATTLAHALARLSRRGRYLFIFSTDLSHYHAAEEAQERDTVTITAMLFETGQAAHRLFEIGVMEACGRGPIVASLLLAQELGYPDRQLLAVGNSGATTGDMSRVVGYAAIAMYARPPPSVDRLSESAGAALLDAARQTLEAHFTGSAPPPLDAASQPELTKARGMFVTIRKGGALRGCIGRIASDVPLATLLPQIAIDAATRDPRFPPMRAEELRDVVLDVSVLTPPQPVKGPQAIVAGRDGVVLQQDQQSGVFLPQVWQETGWTKREFLDELASQKAGLPRDAWRTAKLFTFQAQAFEESSAPEIPEPQDSPPTLQVAPAQ
jgi:AmmeMemoRadiSam system protein B/AmmeMemoRadiSam system protein A